LRVAQLGLGGHSRGNGNRFIKRNHGPEIRVPTGLVIRSSTGEGSTAYRLEIQHVLLSFFFRYTVRLQNL
jgi:hypothetical protein